MNKFFLGVVVILVSVLGSCKSESNSKHKGDDLETALDDAKNNVDDATDHLKESADDLKENLEEQADNLKHMLKDVGSNAELISLDDLRSLCPKSLDGMSRENLSGEGAGAFGFKMHTVKANYEKGDKSIKLEIIDFGGFSPALLGLASWSATEVYKENDDEFERVIEWKGHRAFEKSDKRKDESSIAIIYKKRLIINASAGHIPLDELKDIVADELFGKLDRLDLTKK